MSCYSLTTQISVHVFNLHSAMRGSMWNIGRQGGDCKETREEGEVDERRKTAVGKEIRENKGLFQFCLHN